jgi:quercetin dioxygenase-like cupin family protein
VITVVRRGGGTPSARSEGPYTGEIWRDLLHNGDDGFSVGKVFFTPCARTFWHSHPGGQLLVVEHGDGIVADEEETVHVAAGDVIWTPPDVRHWHGATSTRSMMHTAITLNGVDWQEEVSEQLYAAANSG